MQQCRFECQGWGESAHYTNVMTQHVTRISYYEYQPQTLKTSYS